MKKFIYMGMIFIIGCSSLKQVQKSELDNINNKIDSKYVDAALQLNISNDSLINLIEKPIYQMKPHEVDAYLKLLFMVENNLQERIKIIALKNLNQPYKIYLLGEFPVELYPDIKIGGLYPTEILGTQPTFTLDKSDCVVFCEHTYAMALSRNWKEFYAYLQRIRYKDGEISFLMRNHYTEYDWDNNNSWLVKDFIEELPDKFTKRVHSRIDKAAFFKRYNIGQDTPPIEFDWKYIPLEYIDSIISTLNTGDFVNFVRGFGDDASTYVGHTGIIIRDNDSVYVIHSTEPKVRIDNLQNYVYISQKTNLDKLEHNKINDKKKPILYGFRFLRLQKNPIENLKKIDGPRAPFVKFYGN